MAARKLFGRGPAGGWCGRWVGQGPRGNSSPPIRASSCPPRTWRARCATSVLAPGADEMAMGVVACLKCVRCRSSHDGPAARSGRARILRTAGTFCPVARGCAARSGCRSPAMSSPPCTESSQRPVACRLRPSWRLGRIASSVRVRRARTKIHCGPQIELAIAARFVVAFGSGIHHRRLAFARASRRAARSDNSRRPSFARLRSCGDHEHVGCVARRRCRSRQGRRSRGKIAIRPPPQVVERGFPQLQALRPLARTTSAIRPGRVLGGEGPVRGPLAKPARVRPRWGQFSRAPVSRARSMAMRTRGQQASYHSFRPAWSEIIRPGLQPGLLSRDRPAR